MIVWYDFIDDFPCSVDTNTDLLLRYDLNAF